MDPEVVRANLQKHPAASAKLVLHRGWHSLNDDYDWRTGGRPLENTRLAYTYAARSGVGFAECDVWSTSDGKLVLSHDCTLASMALDGGESAATSTSISKQEWADIKDVLLKDGSKPVLLSTILQDLASTGTRLVIELKESGPAKPLAMFLEANPELLLVVGCVISFSLVALETFASSRFHNNNDVKAKMWSQFWPVRTLNSSIKPKGPSARTIPTLWLVDNPSVPYDPLYTNEGETTFDYASMTLTNFLAKEQLIERIRRLRCGLSVQYSPSLTPSYLRCMRSELEAVWGAPAKPGECVLGLWSDASLDPGVDTAASLERWLPDVDVLNTDMPPAFWNPARETDEIDV